MSSFDGRRRRAISVVVSVAATLLAAASASVPAQANPSAARAALRVPAHIGGVVPPHGALPNDGLRRRPLSRLSTLGFLR